MNKQKLKIIADGPIIAIANATRYNETLKNQTNWTWKQVNEFFLETNRDHLIIFETVWEDEYRVIVKQLFNHNADDYDGENKVNYVIELFSEPKNPEIQAEKIIWTEDFPTDDSYFLNDETNELDEFLDQLLNKKILKNKSVLTASFKYLIR